MHWLKNNLIFFGVVLCFIALGVSWERIQINNSLGWDGGTYANITIDLQEHITVMEKHLDHYYFQRIFPCAIVWCACKLIASNLTPSDILHGFLWLNSFCILLSLFFYLKIADLYRLNLLVKWLGFSALFLCFPVIKFPFYYPILSDTTAYCIGFAAFYYYSRSNLLGLAICGLIGAFTYPTLLYSILLLILFPISPLPATPKGMHDKLLTFVILLLVYFAFHVLIAPGPLNGSNQIDAKLYLFSVLALAVYFYRYISVLKPSLGSMWQGMQNLRRSRLLFALLLLVAVKGAMYIFTTGKSTYQFDDFISNILYQSLVNPLAFIVSHTMYFGPAVLLIVCLYRAFSEELQRMGVGAILFVGTYLLIGIGTESRQFIAAVPFFFCVLLKVLNRANLRKKHVLVFSLLCVFLSRFWYPINIRKFEGRYIDFPYQHYFMIQGPWMSNRMYLLQGGITLAIFLWTWTFTNKLKDGMSPSISR